MNRVTSETRALAERLIAFEARGQSAGEIAAAAYCIGEKLRPPLATLMGTGGYNALVSRALAVAQAEHPWLGTVQLKADGTIGVPNESEAFGKPEAMAEGSVVLVSHLLELLVAFIGEALTLRMVRDTWPKLFLGESDSRKGDTK